MSTQLAGAEPVNLVLVREAVRPSVPSLDERFADDERRVAARGVIIAVMIACPIWVLVGLAVWWL
jgi:hypothetical protein